MTDSPASSDAVSRVLLIDLDNCPQQINQLPESFDDFTRIVLCYGSQEPKLPLGLVTSLAEPIRSGKLDIVGMDKKGKNAADFGLTFHAGRLMSEMPQETEFTVLSEDSDLDHAVNLLRSHQRVAQRVNGKRPSQLTAPGITAREYAAHSLQPHMPRPSREETLLNSIKAFCKKHDAVDPRAVMERLKHSGRLEVAGSGKIRYFDVELDEPADIALADHEDDIPF